MNWGNYFLGRLEVVFLWNVSATIFLLGTDTGLGRNMTAIDTVTVMRQK